MSVHANNGRNFYFLYSFTEEQTAFYWCCYSDVVIFRDAITSVTTMQCTFRCGAFIGLTLSSWQVAASN